MDPNSRFIAGMAHEDYERARRKAFWSGIAALLQRRPNALLSFEEVQRALAPQAQVYRGLQQVPVSAIIGSVDRYHDFNRNFLPVQGHTRPRWEAIDRATRADEVLPPVQLYKIGQVYFVKDGNHRVSVARERGQDMIDAEVIECPTSVPITSHSNARDLLGLAEYGRFLEQTKLDKERPGAAIEFTSLGRYDVLLEHISAQRWYMGVEQKHEISWRDAVLSWYDNVYRPLVQVIEESGILDDFPGHTAGDLYLWVMDHRFYLEKETGSPVGASTAVFSYDAHYGRWTRRVLRTLQRLTGQAAKPLIVSARRIRRALVTLRPGAE
ncbi:MAG: transcriptional regulator [Chloroflexia bacterium]